MLQRTKHQSPKCSKFIPDGSSPSLLKLLHLLIMVLCIDAASQSCNSHCPRSYLHGSQLQSQPFAGLLDLLGGLLFCLVCHSRMQYSACSIRHAVSREGASPMQLLSTLRPQGCPHADIIRTWAQTAHILHFLPLYSRTHEFLFMRLQPLQQVRSGHHLATTGVMPIVRGILTGSSAFVHRKATAKDDPLLVSALASQDLSSGFASAFTSFSAQNSLCIPHTQPSFPA